MYTLPNEYREEGSAAGGMRANAFAWIGFLGSLSGLGDLLGRGGGRLVSLPTLSVLMGIGLLIGLNHPARSRIYDHLRRLPGDHLRSVARSLSLAVGTTRYHLDVLRRAGLIYKRATNGRARYYVSEGEAEVNRLYARHWEYRVVRLRVLEALRRLDNAPPATIAKNLGVSRQLVAYHLASLERAGLARREGTRFQPVGGR
jgi:predicted transcriptional regulator